MIVVHHQSPFYLNINDDCSQLSRLPFPNNITHRISRLDDCDDIRPPIRQGIWQTRHVAKLFPSVNLEPEHAEVLSSLRPENRPYFDDFTRGPSISWNEHVLHRKEVLERLGYVELSFSLKNRVVL